MGIYEPELMLLIAVDIFLVLSLLTCLLEREFSTPIPYLLQLASLAGFGQIYVSKEFLDVFSVDLRFWYSLSYLIVAVAGVFASNLYIFVVRREVAKGFLFSGSVTTPAVIFSMFFVSVYTHDIEVPLDLFPRIPLSFVPIAVTLSFGLLALGIFLSTEPSILQRLRRYKGITVSTDGVPQKAAEMADRMVRTTEKRSATSPRRRDPHLMALREKTSEFGRLLREKESEGYDISEFDGLGQRILEDIKGGDIEKASKMLDKVIKRLKTLGPEVPLSTLTDMHQVIEEKKEVKE